MKETVAPQNYSHQQFKNFDEYTLEYQKSLAEVNKYWLDKSKLITWEKNPSLGLEGDFKEVNHKWFSDGCLNVSFNCIDRHAHSFPDKTAIIWAKDNAGEYESISYKKLLDEVSRVANMLKAHGVAKGDRVCLYLPMIPELAYSMLACARLGAIHSVVFAGFSSEALKSRIEDGGCKVVITANEGLRGGKVIPLKKMVDDAIEGVELVEKVFVVKRTASEYQRKKRDLDFNEEVMKFEPSCPPEVMNAEDPLFILYTSGSTGKPKGLVHTSGGYLTYAAHTHKMVFNYKENDIYFCAADIGWITGHSYIIYGPLANGATTVMFESTPNYPNAGRYWQIIEDLKVNIFYTAPTALRSLAQCGDAPLDGHDRSSLKVLGTVGEPINPEVWKWYYEKVGEKKCDIVDTWWQTETGGILISPLPGVTPCKPGSATLPLPGVSPQLVQPENGKLLSGTEIEGALCMKHSWPGQARTIYQDHKRFVQTYFTQYPGLYFTGDGCRVDKDGYYWITGRIDDVLNVSGHRLGTAEVESALMEHDLIAEAAVVGQPHDIKGTGIYAYVILYEEIGSEENLEESIKDIVRENIGRFAAPDTIHITKGLPKTRSGKVMRRILRKIAAHEYDSLGDTSTLADPTVVEALIEEHKKLQVK